MELNMKIRQLRKMTGLTQEQMSNKLNISRQTISKWESGTSIPDWESMVKISKLFNVSLDDFTSMDDEKPPQNENFRITLEDLIEIENYNRKKQLMLIFSVIFMLVSIISIIIVTIVNSSMLSIQYMLYRYITMEEYSFLPADYLASYVFAIISGMIGLFFGGAYFFLLKRKRKNNKF